MAQEALKILESEDKGLDKRTGSLSETESKNLKEAMRKDENSKEKGKMKEETLNLKISRLDIKDTKGNKIQKTLSVSDLISAIGSYIQLSDSKENGTYLKELQEANIPLGNGVYIEKGQFNNKSELIALMQVALNLSPDGSFGRNSALVFNTYSKGIKTSSEKQPESKIVGGKDIDAKNFPGSYNAYQDFKSIFTETVANQYRDTYQLFDRGYLKSFIKNGDNITINYKSQYYNKSLQSLTFDWEKIKNSDENLDREKFIKELKTKLDKKELDLKAKAGKESVSAGIEDVKVEAFSSFMQEYIKGQGWKAINGEIDFNPGVANGSGIQVSGNLVTINFPGHGNVSWKLSDMQTDNKFDQDKFVTKTSEKMTPRARTWKSGELAKNFEDIKKAPFKPKATNDFDGKIQEYKDLINKINNSSTQDGIKVDVNLIKGIKEIIKKLEDQKKYFEMKNKDESKVKGFENFLNSKTPNTNQELMDRQNEINSKKGEYKIFRDDFNNRASLYLKVSYADFVNFNDRLKKIDKTYGYSN